MRRPERPTPCWVPLLKTTFRKRPLLKYLLVTFIHIQNVQNIQNIQKQSLYINSKHRNILFFVKVRSPRRAGPDARLPGSFALEVLGLDTSEQLFS